PDEATKTAVTGADLQMALDTVRALIRRALAPTFHRPNLWPPPSLGHENAHLLNLKGRLMADSMLDADNWMSPPRPLGGSHMQSDIQPDAARSVTDLADS